MSQSAPKKKRAPAPLRPSSSIVLLSPTNQVLLLHRVKTSRSFAAAHVFPGGNLDAFHDGELPAIDTPEVHQDSAAYRLGAIRECFEETGILLARPKGSSPGNTAMSLVSVPEADRETSRRLVHDNKVRFDEWVDSVGGTPDVEGLMPFTRWITPANVGRRFTTQMYLYMIPDGSGGGEEAREMTIPTPDGGVEHTAALFDDASTWLARAASGDDILFPPQVFLLHLVNRFCPGASAPPPADSAAAREHYAAQRRALVSFLGATPTSSAAHPSSVIPWAEKVMSPRTLFVRGSDDRIVLGLDQPGPELRGSTRGGDYERVVLVKFTGDGPRQVEIRSRDEVFREHRAEKADKDEGGGSKL